MLTFFFQKTNNRIITVIFFFVLFCSWISLGSYFYEDSTYIYYATSIIEDQDLNIINQVPDNLRQIVTSNYSHPAHHTIIQTPLIIVLNFLDSILHQIFGVGLKGGISNYQLGGTLLSFLSLMVGFIFTQKASRELGIELKFSHFLIYLFSTAFLYFSFFTVTTIEIYLFSLSAFSLNGIVNIYKGNKEGVNAYSLGIAMGFLISSKITFLCFFLAGIWIIFNSFYKKDNKFLLFFSLGIGFTFLIAIMKDVVSFGEIVMISSNLASHLTLFSWLDIYWTIRQGVFGEGGLFYTNPSYALSLVGMLMLGIDYLKKDKSSLIIWTLFFLWMLMSFFQTITIVGPALDDHYVGRLMLASLPIMLIAFAYAIKKLESFLPHNIKVIASVILLIWQGYTLSNYLAISSLDHYAYAISKTVPHFSDLIDHIVQIIKWKNEIMRIDLFKFTIFTLGATFLLSVIYIHKDKLQSIFNYYLHISIISLLLISVLNMMNSRKNGMSYIEQKNLKGKVAIINDPAVYSFVYITDALRTELYNSRDPLLSELIKNTHLRYLDKLKPLIKEGSPELLRAIEVKDLNYSFYSK